MIQRTMFGRNWESEAICTSGWFEANYLCSIGRKKASVKDMLQYEVATCLSYERSFMQAVALTTGRATVVLLDVFAVHLERHCLPTLRLAEMIQSINQ